MKAPIQFFSFFLIGLLIAGGALGQRRKSKAHKEPSCKQDIDCPGDMRCRSEKCVSLNEAQESEAPASSVVAPVAPEPEPGAAPEPAPEPEPEVEPPVQQEPAAAMEEVTSVPAAAVEGPPPVSYEAPVNKAKGGIVTGLIIDIVGFGLFIGGGAVVSISLPIGLILGYMGGMVITVGSTVSTISFSVRHAAYVNAGFNPSGGRRTASWILTGATLASFGGGLAMGLVSDGSFGLAIGSICLNGAAVILEVINFYSRQKWDLRLKESAAATSSSAIVTPAVFAATDPATGRQTPMFGVAGVF